MSKLVICIALGLAAIASPAFPKEPCPPNKYPPPYPWLVEGPMYGDEYGEIYIDIDKAGKPVGCRMGRNNIPGDNKFFVCQAFMDQWRTSPRPNDPAVGPPPANLPANSPVKATVHRTFISYGADHEKAERNARKRFFQQHPDERTECYPD